MKFILLKTKIYNHDFTKAYIVTFGQRMHLNSTYIFIEAYYEFTGQYTLNIRHYLANGDLFDTYKGNTDPFVLNEFLCARSIFDLLAAMEQVGPFAAHPQYDRLDHRQQEKIANKQSSIKYHRFCALMEELGDEWVPTKVQFDKLKTTFDINSPENSELLSSLSGGVLCDLPLPDIIAVQKALQILLTTFVELRDYNQKSDGLINAGWSKTKIQGDSYYQFDTGMTSEQINSYTTTEEEREGDPFKYRIQCSLDYFSDKPTYHLLIRSQDTWQKTAEFFIDHMATVAADYFRRKELIYDDKTRAMKHRYFQVNQYGAWWMLVQRLLENDSSFEWDVIRCEACGRACLSRKKGRPQKWCSRACQMQNHRLEKAVR